MEQTKGFAIVELDEAFCTGSSMMPQKKNADFVELARGASGVFISNLTGFLVTLKALPTSYNRDLQWDKRYVFDSVETCEMILGIFTELFRTVRWDKNKLAELLKDKNLYTTHLPHYLFFKGGKFLCDGSGRLSCFERNAFQDRAWAGRENRQLRRRTPRADLKNRIGYSQTIRPEGRRGCV